MCGRFSLLSPNEVIEDLVGAWQGSALQPRYNISPGMLIPVVRGCNGAREAAMLRWGFVARWAREQPAKLLINARAETLFEKPSFRQAARKRRCLVPADGFYEWRRGQGLKQPYFITPSAGGVIFYGAIWESWQMPSGEELETVAIITNAANQTLSAIHHRMPVVIDPQDLGSWLDPTTPRKDIERLLAPVSDDYFIATAISDAVNKTANNSPDIQIPVAKAASADSHPMKSDQFSLFDH